MKKFLSIILFIVLCPFSGQAQEIDQKRTASQHDTLIQEIKIFPNPATNVVNILGLKNSDKADILISDAYGNALLKHQWRIKNNAINIPIASLESGIYMVTIVSQEQKVQTKFFKK